MNEAGVVRGFRIKDTGPYADQGHANGCWSLARATLSSGARAPEVFHFALDRPLEQNPVQ